MNNEQYTSYQHVGPHSLYGYLAAMRKLLFIISLFATLTLSAQTEIKLDELASHIGDSVTVKGKTYGVRYLQSARNTPTFINVGGAFPNQLLTIVIWDDARKKLGFAPEEEKYANGMAVFTGKVELYRGKPQIVITNPEQLKIFYDEEVSSSQIPAKQQRK